jgi:septum formation protein
MKFSQTKTIILASGSPRRKEYLERYQLKYRIIKPDIDETPFKDEGPVTYAKRMAKEKVESISGDIGYDEIALSADTIVVYEDNILGKPVSTEDAYQMLTQLNGQVHSVVTAYALLLKAQNSLTVESVCTKVTFNELPEAFLRTYAESEEPLDKAGSYSIQGDGTFLVNAIEGSYNNVVGLPVEQLIQDFLKLKVITI